MEAQLSDEAAIQMALEQQGGHKRGPSCPAAFYLRPIQNEVKSIEAGRPIFEEREFIRLWIPGDKDNIIEREVRHSDKIEYAEQYRLFKANAEQPITGTILEKVPFLTSAQVAELKAVNVRTAEELVAMADGLAQRFMGIQAIKRRCNDFLEAAKGAAVHETLRAELEKRDNDIATLKHALEEQGEMLKKLQRKG